jgi:hypothetical protein
MGRRDLHSWQREPTIALCWLLLTFLGALAKWMIGRACSSNVSSRRWNSRCAASSNQTKLEIKVIDFHESQTKKIKGEVRSVGVVGDLTREGDHTRDETSNHSLKKW